MLEVIKGYFSKNYENSFFREFAKLLSLEFQKKDIDGLLIGGSYCIFEENLQIDALLLTNNAVCIIDFKNFGGIINLPDEKNFESLPWLNAIGIKLKAGSYVNPFFQLKEQKRRFTKVFNRYINPMLKDDEKLNPSHCYKVVCFQEKITLNGKIPDTEKLNFFIFDKFTFLNGILDIIDVKDIDVSLTKNAFTAFSQVFTAKEYEIDSNPKMEELREIAGEYFTTNYTNLYEDQKEALKEIKSFLLDPEKKAFILKGSTKSGKSYLIPFIKDIAFDNGIKQFEVLASNNLVKNNLLPKNLDDKILNLYNEIYDMGNHSYYSNINKEKNNNLNLSQKDDNVSKVQNKEDSEKNDISKLNSIVNIIELRQCMFNDQTLVVIDEAQLISDKYYEFLDLRFGTGYLLNDFITFINPSKRNIKVIFIGDPYKLSLANQDEYSLSKNYLESKYSLKVEEFELADRYDFSKLNEQRLKCVEAIRKQNFSKLKFDEGEALSFINKDNFKEKADEILRNQNGHLLYYTNEQANTANLWIKQNILNNGAELSKGDLIYFNNSFYINTQSDPNFFTKRISNGDFATVLDVYEEEKEEIEIPKNPKKSISLRFRRIKVKLQKIDCEFFVFSLENYRLNTKADLSLDEKMAYNIFLYKIAENEIENFKSGRYDVNNKIADLIQTSY